MFMSQSFWDLRLCRWIGGSRRCERTYCLHLQGSSSHYSSLAAVPLKMQAQSVTPPKTWTSGNTAVRSSAPRNPCLCTESYTTLYGEDTALTNVRIRSNYVQAYYRGADKSLARPTSRCILFDGENISFDASLVI